MISFILCVFIFIWQPQRIGKMGLQPKTVASSPAPKNWDDCYDAGFGMSVLSKYARLSELMDKMQADLATLISVMDPPRKVIKYAEYHEVDAYERLLEARELPRNTIFHVPAKRMVA